MGSTGEVETLTAEPIWFSESNPKMTLRSLRILRSNSGIKIKSSSSDEVLIQEALCFKKWAEENLKIDRAASRNQDLNENKLESRGIESPASDPVPDLYSETCLPELPCTGPMSKLDDAALKLQKVYKGYRTRRNLADCAVVVEELWWKALDFASLRRCSISFFSGEKRESAVSRWARARTRAAKVGKGLSKNEKAQKLALQHWLEAIDPRHRYGHNLHFYYDVWSKSESTQPFFYWLDIGDGKETNLEKCPRNILQYQCVTYLGPNERKAYEVIFENGKLVHKLSRRPVSTVQGSKWIFVLSTSRAMYVGQKKKGKFQHSSFLAGGATTAAGRLVVKQGILKAVWPYSGHYLPTEENFKDFISFLQENNVDLSDVRTCSISNDERPSFNKLGGHSMNSRDDHTRIEAEEFCEDEMDKSPRASARCMFDMDNNVDKITHESSDQAACKWTTGTGPRIRCVRDYPTDLQCKALEQVNLPPTDDISPTGSKGPIPSPRPGTGLMVSPMLTNMSFPAPTISLAIPKQKKR